MIFSSNRPIGPFQTMELAIGSIMREIFFPYSNTYPFNYLFGDKELLARQVALGRFNLVVAMSVCLMLFNVCPLPLQFFCV